ncbi:MAG: 50S ribosomal protein L13 [Candidatus Theseobacter exili]|nr:50S ribosomal protein L13 [Candidatus Theseobacter exili]
MKTFVQKPADVQRKWCLINADGKILGRMAVKIANILRGKNKPSFTPHVDNGDFVIVINAEKVAVTGKKAENKVYQHYTGYPSGLREEVFSHLQARKPERIIELAVRGMMPKNRLARTMIKKLKVYRGSAHPHEAQQPETIEV